MNSGVDTENWYQEYKEDANFLMVYIEEAHPGNSIEGLEVNAATSMEEKLELAELCTTSGDLNLPTVLDELDNAVEIAYAAFPDRIYVLDADGVVQYKTATGPFGWDIEEATAGLEAVLAEVTATTGG